MIRLEMKNFNMIWKEKQQKISALSPDKLDKYEYLTGEKILPSDRRRMKEQVKFTYSPLGKASEKQWRWKTRRKTNKSNWRSWKTTGWI